VWRETITAPSATFSMGKKCENCGITGHFAHICRGGTRQQARQQQSNFVSKDTNEEVFLSVCDRAIQFTGKYFAKIHGEKLHPPAIPFPAVL